MSSIRRITAALIAMALIFAAGLSVATPPEHAKGNPPEKVYWIDEFGEPSTFEFPFIPCDGFGTVMTMTIAGFWMTHHETPGKDGWEFYHSAQISKISNADDDSMFVEGIPGQVMNRHWTAEPFASDPIETGVQLMITLPGYGVIFRDVGRLHLDWDSFEPVFLAGHWDSFDEDYQALCAALTP
jgi:hypothetical protein